MFYDDNIKLRQVNLDEFQKGILSGEIKPHDVAFESVIVGNIFETPYLLK